MKIDMRIEIEESKSGLQVKIEGMEYVLKTRHERQQDNDILKAFKSIYNYMLNRTNKEYVFSQLKGHGYFMTNVSPRIFVNDLVTYSHAPLRSSRDLKEILALHGEAVTEEALKIWLINQAYCHT